MRRLVSLLTAALLLPAAATATPFNGSVLISCNPAAQAQVDPIVSFGVTPSDHMHAFFGSNAASSTTTLPQMLAGSTSCDVKSDKSLYWHPSIVAADGHQVFPGRSSFYYRAANRGVPIHPFPMGVHWVYGDHSNLSAQKAVARWTCAGVTQSVIPATCGGAGVQETIYVSTCWDGMNLGAGMGGQDSVTGSQPMATAPGNPPVCPADHPVNVPSLQFILNWPADAVGGRLSSDDIGAAPGASAHVDVAIAWTFNSQGHDALSLLTDECLNVDAVSGAVTCRPNAAGVINRTSDGSYVTD